MNPDILKLKDHKWYLENLTKIKTKAGGLRPFILNEAQKDLFNTLNENSKVIILKSRQMGFSTAVAGYLYVETVTNPGITSVLIGYNGDMVRELFDKVKTFYKTTPAQLRPTVRYDTKDQMDFPKLNSKIMVLPCIRDVGRGLTIHRCLATELPAWEDAETKYMGLLESIPEENGKIIVEATPKGIGGLYHRLWATKDNGYVKKKYGWWWGYTKEQMEKKRKEIGDLAWEQEYNCSFLSSGRSVFDPMLVRKQRINVLEPDDTNKQLNIDGYAEPECLVRDEYNWRIYREPHHDGVYCLGGDVSEGVDGGDFSAVTVWNRKTGEQVARYHGLIPPDQLAIEIDRVGRRYNNALAVVEANNHGIMTVIKLRDLGYPSPYFRPAKLDSMGLSLSERLGWKTNKATRPILMGDFSQMLRDGSLIIHDEMLLNEMSTFVFDDNGNMICVKGMHDDCLFGAAIGLQGFKILYTGKLDQINYEKFMPTSFSY